MYCGSCKETGDQYCTLVDFSSVTKFRWMWSEKIGDGSPYISNLLLHNKWYYYIYFTGCYCIFGSLIPFIMLLFFCVRIITLRAARKQPIDRHGDRLQNTKVTTMVLTLLAVFLVCDIIWWINNFVFMLSPHPFFYTMWFHYTVFVSDIVVVLNSSVNGFIYFVHIRECRRTLCRRCYNRPETTQAYELS